MQQETEKFGNNKLSRVCTTLFNYIRSNISLILFFVFLFIYISVGMCFSYYSFDFLNTHFNTIFGADTPRVIGDFTQIGANHYRTAVHPLQLILIQPFISFVNGFFHDMPMAIIIAQSLAGASVVALLNSTLYNFTLKKDLSLIFSSIYGVSFSAILFTAIPETYVFSALFNILLWYYISLFLKNNVNKLSWANVLVLSLITIASFGIIMANAIITSISVLFLLASVYKSNLKNVLKDFGKICLISISLTLGLVVLQKVAWHAPLFFENLLLAVTKPNDFEEYKYMDFSISIAKTYQIYLQNFIAPITAIPFTKLSGLTIETNSFRFNNCINLIYILPVTLLYLVGLFGCFIKKSIDPFVTLGAIIILEILFSYFYGWNSELEAIESFIYSQNYLLYLFLFIGLAFNFVWNNITKAFLGCLFLYQLIVNFYFLSKIFVFLQENATKNFNGFVMFIYGLLITAIIAIFIFFVKKVLADKILTSLVEQRFFYGSLVYLFYIVFYAIIVSINYWRVYYC